METTAEDQNWTQWREQWGMRSPISVDACVTVCALRTQGTSMESGMEKLQDPEYEKLYSETVSPIN